jgi:hypothetical protein
MPGELELLVGVLLRLHGGRRSDVMLKVTREF